MQSFILHAVISRDTSILTVKQLHNNKTIAILINPLPGGKRERVANTIIDALTQRRLSFISFRARWPEDINSYKEVWIVGGDGTLNYFLNFYKNILLPIVLFKAGTGNDFAWKLYGNKDTGEQIEHVLKALPQWVDAATCNDRIFINGAGIGFDGEVVRAIKTIRFLGRHMGYLWVVLQKICTFKEYAYEVSCNGRLISGKLLLVAVTNSSRVGGGFMVSPLAKLDDGKLNMLLCKPLTVLERLKNLPLIEKGRHLHKAFIVHMELENAEVVCEHETYAHLDGELIKGREFSFTILPQKYRFKY